MGASIPLASAAAQDSSPYVVGHWRLNDSFRDFKPGAPITTTNTDFVFLNPTGLTLTLEYAFRQPARRVNCATDLQKTWFALNSLVEEDGFGPSIPREHDQR